MHVTPKNMLITHHQNLLEFTELNFFYRFSPEVQQICLPNPEDKIKDDLQCVISGWGKTDRKYFP